MLKLLNYGSGFVLDNLDIYHAKLFLEDIKLSIANILKRK